MSDKPKVTVSVVSFNTRDILLITLDKLFAHTHGLALQVIVVDNGSADGSADAVAERFPNVRLIRNPTNRLFSAAHNQAWRLAEGEFFFILNSDAEIEDGILPRMVAHLRENPRTGGVGSRMYFADGRLQRNCSRDYSLSLAFLNFTLLGKCFRSAYRRLNDATFYSDWNRESSRPVEVIPDSFLLVRKQAISGDLYDERFGLYFTENDLCLRLRRAGWKLDYLAEGRVVHQECQSVNRVDPAVISRIYRRDIWGYFRKYSGLLPAALLIGCLELTRGIAQALHRSGLKRLKKNLVWGIAG